MARCSHVFRQGDHVDCAAAPDPFRQYGSLNSASESGSRILLPLAGFGVPPWFHSTIVDCTFAPFGMNTCRSCVHSTPCHVCEVSDRVYTTLPFAYNGRERAILGWAGLRGAVPVVLATFPVIEQVGRSVEFFNLVFFAVLVSTVVQGSTFEPFARRLRLTTTEPALPRPLSESGTIRRLGAERHQRGL